MLSAILLFSASDMNNQTPVRHSWRDSKLLAIVEFAIVAAIFFADMRGHIFISKMLYLLVLAWISLRLRGLGWKMFRIDSPARIGARVLVAGILAGIGIELLELFVTQPLLVRLTGKMPDLALFSTSSARQFQAAAACAWC